MNQEIMNQHITDSENFYGNAVPYSDEQLATARNLCEAIKILDSKLIKTVPQGEFLDKARETLKAVCNVAVKGIIEDWEREQQPEPQPESVSEIKPEHQPDAEKAKNYNVVADDVFKPVDEDKIEDFK